MNEVNAIETSGAVESAPVTCCPDAKREGDKSPASAAPPLSGRRCMASPALEIKLCRITSKWRRGFCLACPCTVERSVPDNEKLCEEGGK